MKKSDDRANCCPKDSCGCGCGEKLPVVERFQAKPSEIPPGTKITRVAPKEAGGKRKRVALPSPGTSSGIYFVSGERLRDIRKREKAEAILRQLHPQDQEQAILNLRKTRKE